MKLYRYCDELLVAHDDKDAKRMLREERGVRPTKACPLNPVVRRVELQRIDRQGEIVNEMCTPTEAVAAFGYGFVPEGE
jgi:hypothetical protein